MREFAIFSPKFWVSGPGKKFRGDPSSQIVASYLFTSPSSNHIGIYYLPIGVIAHDTGLPKEDAEKGLRRAIEGAFCHYDDPSETVFVVEMAQFQILERATTLKPADHKVKGIHKEVNKYRESPLYPKFFERYQDAFLLDELPPLLSPLEAPSKGRFFKRQETGDRKQRRETRARAREATGMEIYTPSFLKERFNEKRREAGHGPYSPKTADDRHADDALVDVRAMATEREVEPGEVIDRSMRNYFLHADKGLREKGFPFWGWSRSVAHFYDEKNHRGQSQPGDRSKYKGIEDDSAKIIGLAAKAREKNA
jgi:hypothetical protein